MLLVETMIIIACVHVNAGDALYSPKVLNAKAKELKAAQGTQQFSKRGSISETCDLLVFFGNVGESAWPVTSIVVEKLGGRYHVLVRCAAAKCLYTMKPSRKYLGSKQLSEVNRAMVTDPSIGVRAYCATVLYQATGKSRKPLAMLKSLLKTDLKQWGDGWPRIVIVMKLIGEFGADAKSAIPQLRELKGRNKIIDARVDEVIKSIESDSLKED